MASLSPVGKASYTGTVTAPCTDLDRAIAEALAFPARHLAGLPLPVRFGLEGYGLTEIITWSSEPDPRSRSGIVFDAAEVQAIVIAVEAERLRPSDLKGYCLRKLHDPGFRVTVGLALDGAQPQGGVAWPLARVLRHLDLELYEVSFAGSSSSWPPSSQSRAA
jgi:hypothetical protein